MLLDLTRQHDLYEVVNMRLGKACNADISFIYGEYWKQYYIEQYRENFGYIHTAEMIYSYFGCKYVATTLHKSYSASRNGWSAMLYDAEALEAYFSTDYDIQIVDRVGGEDSFAAGLIYAMTQKMGCQNAIDFATAASCLKQTIEGDYNSTTVADVQNLLNNGGNGRVQR